MTAIRVTSGLLLLLLLLLWRRTVAGNEGDTWTLIMGTMGGKSRWCPNGRYSLEHVGVFIGVTQRKHRDLGSCRGLRPPYHSHIHGTPRNPANQCNRVPTTPNIFFAVVWSRKYVVRRCHRGLSIFSTACLPSLFILCRGFERRKGGSLTLG